jgi:hypothetical protein
VTDAERIERIARLEGAIRRHRDYRGDDRCHLDDFELYAALDDGAEPDLTLPPREEFLASCERYWSQRRTGTCIAGLTIAQLEADVEQLRADRDKWLLTSNCHCLVLADKDAEIARLTVDRAALLSLHVAAWPSGGWAARLRSGRVALGGDWYHFEDRESAVAAVLGAAREAQGKGGG